MSSEKTSILDPTGLSKSVELRLVPRPADLKGLTVGLLDYGRWVTFGTVFKNYARLLKERYAVGDVIYVNTEKEGMEKGTSRESTVEALASRCHVVLLGLGRGSCTATLVLEGIEFEKRGIPAVVFVTDWFLSMADKVKKGEGLPDLNFVAVPHHFDELSEGEAMAIADGILEKAIAAITTLPLSA